MQLETIIDLSQFSLCEEKVPVGFVQWRSSRDCLRGTAREGLCAAFNFIEGRGWFNS